MALFIKAQQKIHRRLTGMERMTGRSRHSSGKVKKKRQLKQSIPVPTKDRLL